MTDLLSRRTALLNGAGIVVGAAVLLFDSPSTANATIQPPADPGSERLALLPRGFTDLAGIRAEYQKAVESWPFALPEGFSFSPFSSLSDEKGPTYWEYGSGVAEAFFYWSTATATAAFAAYGSGKARTAQYHLAALVASYDSDLVRSVFDDSQLKDLRESIEQVQSAGNYAPLVDLFQLENEDALHIAKAR